MPEQSSWSDKRNRLFRRHHLSVIRQREKIVCSRRGDQGQAGANFAGVVVRRGLWPCSPQVELIRLCSWLLRRMILSLSKGILSKWAKRTRRRIQYVDSRE